ncbi:hypothetical protein E2562_031161 [Oryza meyeriana var. granulata]|uniref:Uncharacterized protein n=1 Tax=Oryza meyeriana var. granulata TaxID=110450 RepID=A0A6G1EBV7_9ORYZ|nr:hypothetical protein E2562_031161 [Oryza meyeriana var. granulata]
MSRYLKQYEKEHMKMAMLKQEETFKQQVQELHRLYRVQKRLMTAGSETTMPTIRCMPEDEHHAEENEAGSSRPWDAYPAISDKQRAPTTVLEESELELTLAIGSFGRTTTTMTKKDAPSSSVDSRTSNSSSSTESGSPHFRAMMPSRLGSSSAAGVGTTQQHLELEQEDALKQPPWLHQCLNLAR